MPEDNDQTLPPASSVLVSCSRCSQNYQAPVDSEGVIDTSGHKCPTKDNASELSRTVKY